MVTVAIAEFYEKISSDSALRQKVLAGSNGDVDSLIENAVWVGSTMGYVFSMEDARTFADNLSELPDDILELVAAGSTCTVSVQRSQL